MGEPELTFSSVLCDFPVQRRPDLRTALIPIDTAPGTSHRRSDDGVPLSPALDPQGLLRSRSKSRLHSRTSGTRSVTCDLAATAIIIVAFLPFPPIANWMGLKRCHFAGIVIHRDNYLTNG